MGTLTGAAIVFCQVFCEVGKQVTSYSVHYYNGGTYPVPQTMLVLLGEIIKLFTTLARTGCAPPSIDFISLRQSVKFLIPSIFYAVNNNIYFIGLMYVPPPIWIILCSFRTVITATVYKFILKRNISPLQYIGAICIVLSIIVAKLDDGLTTSTNTLPSVAIVLAVVASCNSVAAALFTESLFKTSGENFLVQQFWLYLYGFLVSSLVHVIYNTNTGPSQALISLQHVSGGVIFLLVVASILKKLDNIVKEYTGATANMVTALLCSFLFPEKFRFTFFIFSAMILLFIGIFLYENKKINKTVSV